MKYTLKNNKNELLIAANDLHQQQTTSINLSINCYIYYWCAILNSHLFFYILCYSPI